MAHFLPSSSNLGGRAGAATLAALAGGEPAFVLAAAILKSVSVINVSSGLVILRGIGNEVLDKRNNIL